MLFTSKRCPFHCDTSFCYRLCQSKQSKVYLPEAPFPHAEVGSETNNNCLLSLG